MIFGTQILGGFGILMSNMSQVQTILSFQGCDKIVLRLHNAGTENPETPKHMVSWGVWVIFWEIRGARMCLGVSVFSVPAVWSRNTILSQPWNERIVCTWDILDIKIPKPPNIWVPKLIGFVQFLIFVGSVREILQSTVSFDHPVPPHSVRKNLLKVGKKTQYF